MDIVSNLPALRGINDPTLTLDFTVPGTLPSGVVFARASTATYFDSTGTMQTAATNAPRWDYDPVTLGLRGLLLEEARSNVVFPSIPTTSVNPLNTTLTPASGIAPDATNTFVKMAETATTNFHCATLATAMAASQPYTLSIFVKAVEDRYFQLIFDNAASISVYANFDLQAGTITAGPTMAGGATNGGASIQAMGNGVYRCSVSGTLATATSGRGALALIPAPTSGTFPSYAGVAGNGVLIWGLQFEQGAFPTSHIPTTTVAVTRAVDTCSMPVASIPGFSAIRGSLQIEYILEGQVSGFGAPIVLLGANANTDYIDVDQFTTFGLTSTTGQTDGSAVFVANAAQMGAGWDTPLPIPVRTVVRGAAAWNTTTMNAAHNGTLADSLVPGTALPAIVTLGINAPFHSQGPSDMWVRRVQYWPRTLSSAELQTVTGLPSADFDFTTPGVLPVGVTFVRPAPATYTDSAGVIRPSPSGTPRWDYDPITHVLLGLLIEDSRVNSLFPSANWGAAQTPSNSVDGITQNVGVSPSGASDAMACIPGTFSGVHQFYRVFSGAVNTTYVYSVYLKAAGMNYATVGLENSAFVPAQTATFNLATGTVDTQNSQATAAIQAVGGGWYRCSVIATSLASGTNAYVANIKPGFAGGIINVSTGDSVNGVWAWGNQVEAGTYLTSLITTTTVAVTRWADVVNIPIANVAGFNPNAGSLVHQYISKGSIVGYGAIAQFVGSNAATDYISVDETAATSSTPTNVRISGASLSVGGTSLSYTGLPGIVLAPPNVIRRGATSWAAGAYVASAHNGLAGQRTLGPAASMPVITTLQVGGLMHYQNPWSQWAQRIRYWPRQLPTSDLQALTIAPTLDLDFMNAGTLPTGVVFARASPVATYTDSTGTLQTAGYNFISNNTMMGAVAGSPGTLPTNWLITAADGLTTNVVGTGIDSNGVNYIDIRVFGTPNSTAYSLQVENTPNLVAGLPHTISAWTAVVAGSTTNITLLRFVMAGSGGVAVAWNTTAALVRGSGTLPSPIAANYPPTINFTTVSGQAVDITLRIGLPQYEQASAMSAVIKTYGTVSGAPRWDYDPVTKTLNGLLIEGPRTNYAPYSTGSGATWAVASSSLTANAFLAPNGTTTATQLTEDTSNGFHFCDNQGASSIPVNAPVTTSIYIRANTRKFCEFHLYDSTSPGSFVKVPVDLTTGAIGSVAIAGAATAVSYGATSIGNGWWRLRITATLSAAATTGIIYRVVMANVLNGTSYLGDGASNFYIWGAQAEAGQYPTSYIPTTAAAVTRATETVQMAVGAWFNPAGSTLAAEYIYPRGPDTTTAHDVVGLNDGVAPNGSRMVLRALPGFNPTAMMFSNIATTPVNLVFAGAPTTGVSRSAGTWTAGAMTGVLNGNAVGGVVSGLPSGISQLTFGNQALADDGPLMGWVRHVSYWPRIQTDPDLLATSGASVVDRTRVLVMG